MAYRKQNVFHGNANNKLSNGKSYVPAVDRTGHDSESIIAFKGGFGIGQPVYDRRQEKVVYSFEVLDALPGTIMTDSDYVTQNDVINKTGITLGESTSISFDSDNSEFDIVMGSIDSDALTAVNANRSYIWSQEFGTANHVIEGYVTKVPSTADNADDSTISVKPTSSSVGWKAAMADGTITMIYDAANNVIARGKTINDDKNRYADADSDFFFHDDDA
tara:strand:+ start:5384 stop:6040 length:657 start_codon:yes stop_codon:yes gene_type:complete